MAIYIHAHVFVNMDKTDIPMSRGWQGIESRLPRRKNDTQKANFYFCNIHMPVYLSNK